MINIYIKSFNRPFYLDRCIRSVKFNVRNYGKIIILDDGTEQKFINRLMKTHPDVEFRSSGADDGKMALLREEKFAAIEQSYPSAIKFWTDEVAKDGSDYVFILEDDAWVCRQIDLQALASARLSGKKTLEHRANTGVLLIYAPNPATPYS